MRCKWPCWTGCDDVPVSAQARFGSLLISIPATFRDRTNSHTLIQANTCHFRRCAFQFQKPSQYSFAIGGKTLDLFGFQWFPMVSNGFQTFPNFPKLFQTLPNGVIAGPLSHLRTTLVWIWNVSGMEIMGCQKWLGLMPVRHRTTSNNATNTAPIASPKLTYLTTPILGTPL